MLLICEDLVKNRMSCPEMDPIIYFLSILFTELWEVVTAPFLLAQDTLFNYAELCVIFDSNIQSDK